jgi:hypothetical protein
MPWRVSETGLFSAAGGAGRFLKAVKEGSVYGGIARQEIEVRPVRIKRRAVNRLETKWPPRCLDVTTLFKNVR